MQLRLRQPFRVSYTRDQVDDISPPCRLKQYTARYESGKVFRRLEDEPTPAASASSKRESPPPPGAAAASEGGKLLVLGGDIDWRRPPSGAYTAQRGSRYAALIGTW